MATWTARTAQGSREGLTIYQLQQLVRTGAVGPDDEVSSDGPVQKVRDVEVLARHLPERPAAPAADAKFVEINGVRLELGPDGKPVPPPPDVVAQLLASASERPDPERVKRRRNVLLAIAALLFLVETLLLVRLFLSPTPGE